MKNLELTRQIQRLKSLIRKACNSTGDIELQAQWARYFTVIVAGLIENSIPLLYGEYVKRGSNKSVAKFAYSHLLRVQNPKSDRLIRVARQFSETWATDLITYLEDDGRKEAIDGIMNIRHQVAHGKNTGITISQITDYLDRAEAVLAFIEVQVSTS